MCMHINYIVYRQCGMSYGSEHLPHVRVCVLNQHYQDSRMSPLRVHVWICLHARKYIAFLACAHIFQSPSVIIAIIIIVINNQPASQHQCNCPAQMRAASAPATTATTLAAAWWSSPSLRVACERSTPMESARFLAQAVNWRTQQARIVVMYIYHIL